MKKNVLGILITMAVLLTGCGSMNSKLDCPRKGGVMCRSLDDVNRMVDNGEIDRINQANAAGTSADNKPVPTPEVGNTPYPIKDLHPGSPVRYHETVMRIWVAPYEDNNGNYHQDSTLFTVIKPGHWMGKPVTELVDED